MSVIKLPYGKSEIEVFDESGLRLIDRADRSAPLSDAEIGDRLDNPTGVARLEETVADGDSVLIVVPDATRKVGSDQIVNLLVRRLIASGVRPHDIRAIFATGIHRAVTADEKKEILSPFIAQRILALDHRAKDLMHIAGLGESGFAVFPQINGEPVELNRALVEHDHVVLVGGVTFHYFAGFTGGRKLICPGLASERTIAATHRLAFDFEEQTRRAGVGPGILDGSAVHAAFVEAASNIPVSFTVNTITNENGEIVELFCGDMIGSHALACQYYAAAHTVVLDEKFDFVIVSAGGSPSDINMIQAHKALESASRACRDGGSILLVAECPDGLGREDFSDWFDAGSSQAIAEKLSRGYQVNGQTAWSLRKMTETFRVSLLSNLAEEKTRPMGFLRTRSVDEFLGSAKGAGAVMPHGAKVLIRS